MYDPCICITSNWFFTLWHVDPEKDGSDDSCGWSYPRLTKQQMDRLDNLAWWEAREPWFMAQRAKKYNDPARAECLIRGIIVFAAKVLEVKMTWESICKMACELTHNGCENFRGSLCYLPGYHSNFETDTPKHREECFKSSLYSIGQVILRSKRPWYKHPKWHFWHWQLQVHLWDAWKRWMFARCYVCGKGFCWKESVVGRGWDAPEIAHLRCVNGSQNHVQNKPEIATTDTD